MKIMGIVRYLNASLLAAVLLISGTGVTHAHTDLNGRSRYVHKHAVAEPKEDAHARDHAKNFNKILDDDALAVSALIVTAKVECENVLAGSSSDEFGACIAPSRTVFIWPPPGKRIVLDQSRITAVNKPCLLPMRAPPRLA